MTSVAEFRVTERVDQLHHHHHHQSQWRQETDGLTVWNTQIKTCSDRWFSLIQDRLIWTRISLCRPLSVRGTVFMSKTSSYFGDFLKLTFPAVFAEKKDETGSGEACGGWSGVRGQVMLGWSGRVRGQVMLRRSGVGGQVMLGWSGRVGGQVMLGRSGVGGRVMEVFQSSRLRSASRASTSAMGALQ